PAGVPVRIVADDRKRGAGLFVGRSHAYYCAATVICNPMPSFRITDYELPSTVFSGERRPATAGLIRIRVHEHEPLLDERLLVIECHPVQVDERLRIDEHTHPAELVNAVAFARLRVEANVVGQPGATAALHAQSQPA